MYRLNQIGTDPEFFASTNEGVVVSQKTEVSGTKNHPVKLDENVEVHRDNVTVELTIPPSSKKSDFVDSIKKAIDSVENEYGIVLLAKPSHEFSMHELLEFYEETMEFGCSPEFSAYTLKSVIPPDPQNSIRSAGGHVHISYLPNVNQEFTIELVKMLDAFLGIPSIIIDKDRSRRDLYGKAGSYRDKVYGAEYRTLSNFWLEHDYLIEWVFDNTNIAFDYISDGKKLFSDYFDEEEVRKIIDDQNEEAALVFVNKYEIPMPIAS